MYRFIQRTITFLIPLIVLCLVMGVSYVVLDPFRVIHSYDDYYDDSFVGINRDFVSTEYFLRNNPQYQYNSFILGSSRTLAFFPSSWKNYLPNNTNVFSFDASGESIYGIYTKLKYLDKHNTAIDNTLIILCRDSSFEHSGDHKGHIFAKHPLISGKNGLFFHISSYKTFITPKFLLCYLDYLINRKYRSYMGNYISQGYEVYNSPISNERHLIGLEQQIASDSIAYFSSPKRNFYARTGEEQVDKVQRIKEEHLKLLIGIKEILDRNNTSYKVVLSPLYEQIKFNPADMKILKELFNENLYDFTGVNEYTNDKTNYYEWSHYRPFIGDSIMKRIYTHID